MRYTARALALILALLPAGVAAQQFPVVPDKSVVGRIGTGTGSGPSQAIPFGTLAPQLGVQGFNITKYGAIPSLSDNSTAIAAAIAACTAAGGGDIVIPSGNFQYATGQTITTSGCNIRGNGLSSILTYTGSGIGLTIAGGINNVALSNLQIASASTTNILVQVSAFNSSLPLSNVYFNGGGIGLQLTSTNGSTGGSYSVFCNNSTTFNGQALAGLKINPAGAGLSAAHNIYGCNFFGFSQYALYLTNANSVNALGIRVERHLGAGATTEAIHIDTGSQFTFSGWYEDDSNNPIFAVGNNVGNLSISEATFQINVAGGTHTSANAVKVTGTGCQSINLSNIRVSIGGTVGNVFDTGSCAPVYGRNVKFDSGTAAYGFASSASSANVDLDDIKNDASTPTTFTSAQQQVGVGRMAVDLSNYASGTTGTGAIARATSPSFVTPTLGDAAANSLSTPGSPGAGIAMGGTAVPSNSHGALNFDNGGAAYTNSVAAINFNTGGVGLTGTPTAPTATVGTNTTQIATTAFATTNFAALASGNSFVNPSALSPQKIESDSSDATPTSLNNQGLVLRNFNTTNNNYIPLEFHSKDTGGTERTGSGVMGVFSNRSASMVKSDLIFFTRSLSGTINFPVYLSDTLFIMGSSVSASNPAMKASSTTMAFRLGDDSADAPISAAAGTFSGALKSSSASGGVGYATGAGGTVTQATSRTTGVTLNTVSGAITLVSAAGNSCSAGLTNAQTFTVTNSAVAATDTVSLSQKSGADVYGVLTATNIAAGSFKITFCTTGGTTTEQPVFNFNVIKGVTN